MQSKKIHPLMPIFGILSIAILACSTSGGANTSVPATGTLTEEAPPIFIAAKPVTVTATTPPTEISVTATFMVTHSMTPADPKGGKLIYDVESAGTAPEKRAPYGDSYDINRLERPFLQDMTYVSDLDITSFKVAKDNDWWYVNMELVEVDPNDKQDVNYGIELDLDRDGFGDYLIWAHPPYTAQWDTLPVQIFQDNNHNTSGLSAGKSDAPFTADGYETLIFDGSAGGADADLAWVRLKVGSPATVQFAFKRSWSGMVFMLGVIADAGLRDPGLLDYVDRFPIAEAGSSVKENENYPLKALFSVDNTCREAFGFEPTYYEPQICPITVAPSKTPGPGGSSSSEGCSPPATAGCPNGWNSSTCSCN